MIFSQNFIILFKLKRKSDQRFIMSGRGVSWTLLSQIESLDWQRWFPGIYVIVYNSKILFSNKESFLFLCNCGKIIYADQDSIWESKVQLTPRRLIMNLWSDWSDLLCTMRANEHDNVIRLPNFRATINDVEI